LATYSIYFLEESQLLFVKVRSTASPVELASLATPAIKVRLYRSCSSVLEKNAAKKRIIFSLRAYGALILVCNASFRLSPFSFY